MTTYRLPCKELRRLRESVHESGPRVWRNRNRRLQTAPADTAAFVADSGCADAEKLLLLLLLLPAFIAVVHAAPATCHLGVGRFHFGRRRMAQGRPGTRQNH